MNNFFERQDIARRNSRLLMVFFFVAIVAIAATMDIVAMVVWLFLSIFIMVPTPIMPWPVHVLVFAATAGTIIYVSVTRSWEIKKGGGIAIAQMVDARQIVPMKATPLERRLLNVVQEMAIASGSRVPIVYVMDEYRGINAFAAGFEGGASVIVVTRGALERLNRDELQGVVAHEFSHIVNGDMAFNMHMIGVLSGLIFIGAGGAHLLREMAEGKGYGADPRVGPVLFMVGGGLFLVGYVGLFAGQTIKAMVAREREYLADAGAVQYTRNPEGLAGALDQVRRAHSTILHINAEDVSHLFFAEAIYLEEERALSTHPPLKDRIRHLAPHFDFDAYQNRRIDATAELDKVVREQKKAQSSASLSPVLSAAAFLDAIPRDVRTSLESIGGPGTLAIALALSTDEKAMAVEVEAITAAGLETFATNASRLAAVTQTMPREWVLPVADLALGALQGAAEKHRADIARAIQAAIDASPMVSVFRFAYLTFMRSQLVPATAAPKPGNKSIADLRDEAILVLSLMAYAGCAGTTSDPGQSFREALGEIGLDSSATLTPADRCDTQTIAQTMDRLRELAPLAKAKLVRGLYASVTADGAIRLTEAALMRMVGAMLDCPLPPMLAVGTLDTEKSKSVIPA